MFQATLLATLLATPLFGWCVHRYPRHLLLPRVYRFFTLNLAAFYGLSLWLSGDAEVWLGRVFYVWLSVINMFVVSVFWAFIADGGRVHLFLVSIVFLELAVHVIRALHRCFESLAAHRDDVDEATIAAR